MKKWAERNAFTLIFLSFMFVVTWLWFLVIDLEAWRYVK